MLLSVIRRKKKGGTQDTKIPHNTVHFCLKKKKKNPQYYRHHLLKVLQMSDTALKTRSEKFTLTFMCFMLGSCRRSSLCWGVNSSLASAWMPYLSSVQCVFSSHVFFFSHHSAWSDQSFLTSAHKYTRNRRNGQRGTPRNLLIFWKSYEMYIYKHSASRQAVREISYVYTHL